MEAARQNELDALFEQARKLPLEQRARFLDEACAGDLEMREELDSLLAAAEKAPAFFEHLAEAVFAPEQARIEEQLRKHNQTISHYKILEKLGSGSMGVVYKAHDIQLDRPVALKFLTAHLGDDDAAKTRFIHEAKAASALDHLNIATIYEIGEADGQLFIAMAYYEGETLKKKIARGPLPVEEALDYTMQIARGLAKTHAQGIVHRDIKPANVMVTEPAPEEAGNGLVKIVDFGLAKMANIRLTKTGATMGTIAYMSPEQTRGDEVDHRTDIWSLGTVLYEMLTGQLPFRREYEQAVIYSILNEDPAPVTAFNPDLPEALEHIVTMCLEKEKDLRYPTMTDLLGDLEVFAKGSDLSTPLSAMRRRKRKARRGILAGIGVLAALLLLLLAVLSVWQAVLPGGERTPEQRRLLVLPFRMIGEDPDIQDISEGLLHYVTSKLTEMAQLQDTLSVIPTIEVLAEDIESLRQADSTFGVHLVISGSIEPLDDLVRLTLNLIDVKARASLNSRTIDAPATNLLAFQDKVVGKLAELLQIELDPAAEQRLTAGGTTAPGAFEFYLQGQEYLQRYEDEANIDDAIGLFRLAIADDSLYTLAYAALGEAYWRKYAASKDRRWVDEAIRNGEKAVALDDDLAPVRITMGMLYKAKGEYAKAESEFLRALELDPRNAFAHEQLALAYYFQDKRHLAEEYARKAIGLKPDYWDFYMTLAYLYHDQGRHLEAAQQYQQVVRLRPDNPWGYNNLGAQYERIGRYPEAVGWYLRATQANPNATRATAYGYHNLAGIEYRKRNFAEAIRLSERALGVDSTDTLLWTRLANAYYWAGERGKARDVWRRVIEMGEANRQVNPNDAFTLDHLAEAYAKTGQPEQARSMLDLLSKVPQKDQDILFGMARTYEYLNERATALDYLEEALKNGLTLPYVELHTVLLDDLKADVRYQVLIKRYIQETKEADD